MAMAFTPIPGGSLGTLGSGARERLRRAAGILAHVCGLAQYMKRYIEKSRAEEWARFYLNMKNHSANEPFLFTMSDFSKYNLSKKFEKLKTLLFTQPKQRSQENLREIQQCLKMNRSFCSLPNEVQLQLCQTAIYQEFGAESLVLRQGHAPLECYLILAGRLRVVSSNTSTNKNSDILSEFEEGDFIGEICLLTNANRPTSVVCETNVELLVVSKEDFHCMLAQRVQEQYQEMCSFLRNLPLFSSWPKEKIEFLVHCSLRRYYRAGTTIISDHLKSCFLVFITSGHCLVTAQINDEKISVPSWVMKTVSSTLKNFHSGLPSRQTIGVTGKSLERSTVSPKISFSAARKTPVNTKKTQHQGSSPATCFVEIRVLEQGGIFGLEETVGKPCDLHLCLISEGAECIFIPKNLFLAEASTEFRRAVLELVCPYPTEEAIQEYLTTQQVWNEYKDRLLAQHPNTRSRATGRAHFCF
ncbi:cyclic nucleotide-binding domain-containing protein 2-like isoform X1 [Marmota marmota marmota]|uniref:cyclic nucleotide-binding domain-containing protein 2-like isoform X1 n=2 Tax=Marmota marmota marmota TaxID=9994 RepID=UPI002093B591|nr:cyclic nucleotide-binding domain-containing protein 2-like isoform X1 [Marmota marmota marmota]